MSNTKGNIIKHAKYVAHTFSEKENQTAHSKSNLRFFLLMGVEVWKWVGGDQQKEKNLPMRREGGHWSSKKGPFEFEDQNSRHPSYLNCGIQQVTIPPLLLFPTVIPLSESSLQLFSCFIL